MGYEDYWELGSGLLQAYLRGDYKPVVKPAVRESLEYGATHSGWDWLAGDTGLTPSGSGLVGGGSTLISGLLTGETEGLAGKTAASAAGGYAGNALARQVAANGGSAIASGVMGAGIGGVATGMYEGFSKGKLSTGTQWGTIGGMVGSIFGPVGTLAGGVIGGLAAGMLGADAPKVTELANYDNGTQNGIFYNEKTGRYETGKVTDVSVTVGGKKQNLSPGQKKGLAAKLEQENARYINELNERLTGVDAVLNNPNASQADRDRAVYQKDIILSNNSNSMAPRTEEELKEAYAEYVADINTLNAQSAGMELNSDLPAGTYEEWKATQGLYPQNKRDKKRIETLLGSSQMPEITGYEQTESGLNPVYKKPDWVGERKKGHLKGQYDWAEQEKPKGNRMTLDLQNGTAQPETVKPVEQEAAAPQPGRSPIFSLMNALGGKNAEAGK